MKEHCLFCGKSCSLKKDPKHPDRWRAAYLCKTSDRKTKPIYKECVLKICDEWDDEWASKVRVRLSDTRANHDLHAADARYHDDCRKNFSNYRNIASAKRSNHEKEVDVAYNKVLENIESETNKMWTSVELHEFYIQEGGSPLSRRKLVERIHKVKGESFLLLKSPGIASILIPKTLADKNPRIQEVENEDIDPDDAIRDIGKIIEKETKDIPFNKKTFNTKYDLQTAKSDISTTLSKLLAAISPTKLSKDSLPAILLGNVITSVVTNRWTDLQVSLAVMVRSKQTVQHLSDYSVVCSYDELLRFRYSAAVFASTLKSQAILQHCSKGLVQSIADNFDCNISSLTGLEQTHCLALMMIQSGLGEHEDADTEIPRLRKEEMKESELSDVEVLQYHGPKKPLMPAEKAKLVENTESLIGKRKASYEIALDKDLET